MAAANRRKRKLNGLRMTEIVKTTVKDVMYAVFLWGTPDKSLYVNLNDYFQNSLTDQSSAHYWRVHPRQRIFDDTQLVIIARDTSGSSFDVTLLHKVIKLACRDVAPFNDDKWRAGLIHLESLLTTAKNERNEVCHEGLEMSDTEFLDKVTNLREVLAKILRMAKERFGRRDTELREKTQKMDDSLFEVCYQVLGEEELLLFSHATIMNYLITEGKVHLSNLLQNYIVIYPLHFLPDSGVIVRVEKVFVRIRITHGNQRDQGTDMDYSELLTIAQGGHGRLRPQLLLIDGVAGSGKTTLLALVTQEWLDGGHNRLRGLNQYQLMLRIQCRDRHIKSFTELLQHVMPVMFCKYRNLTLPLIKTSRLLVLVDGLDECNRDSAELVADILDVLKDSPKCTLLITSRPEAITSFKRNIPQQYKVSNIELLGIVEADRPKVVRQYFQEFKRQTNRNQNIDQLEQTVRQICHQEHFKLPLNLVFLAWQYLYDPNSVRVTNTQTDLYHWAHTLSKLKLQEQLATLLPHFRTMPEDEVKELVEECLGVLYLTMLQTLAHHQLVLTPQMLHHVRTACGARGLPPQQLLSAFFNIRVTWTPQGFQNQFSAPHKGLQEYYGALHIVNTLIQEQQHPTTSSWTKCIKQLWRRSESGSSIMKVLEAALGVGQVEIRSFQNLLRQLAGLLRLHMNLVPDRLAVEVVELLYQTGMRLEDQWLDLIVDTKPSAAALAAIANHIHSGEVIIVKEERVSSYSALLPHLRDNVRLVIDTKSEPSKLVPLIPAVYCHSDIELRQHWYHPHPTFEPDPFLQALLSSSNQVIRFKGQGTVGLNKLPSTLEHLSVAVADDSQVTTLLPLLHSQKCLKNLEVHVAVAVSPAAITSNLPDVYISRLPFLSVLQNLERPPVSVILGTALICFIILRVPFYHMPLPLPLDFIPYRPDILDLPLALLFLPIVTTLMPLALPFLLLTAILLRVSPVPYTFMRPRIATMPNRPSFILPPHDTTPVTLAFCLLPIVLRYLSTVMPLQPLFTLPPLIYTLLILVIMLLPLVLMPLLLIMLSPYTLMLLTLLFMLLPPLFLVPLLAFMFPPLAFMFPPLLVFSPLVFLFLPLVFTFLSFIILQDLSVISTIDFIVWPVIILLESLVFCLSPNHNQVRLYLSDVRADGESRACEVAARLQSPSLRYETLVFPRSSLSPGGWRRVLEELDQRGVRVGRQGVLVSGEPTIEDHQLDTFARTRLGGGFTRAALSEWIRR